MRAVLEDERLAREGPTGTVPWPSETPQPIAVTLAGTKGPAFRYRINSVTSSPFAVDTYGKGGDQGVSTDQGHEEAGELEAGLGQPLGPRALPGAPPPRRPFLDSHVEDEIRLAVVCKGAIPCTALPP